MKRTALRAKSLKRKRTKPGPWRSKAYLAWVRSLPCCVTGKTDGVVAHHLLRGTGEKCGGRRSGDNWAIALHWKVHDALHADGNEERFLAERGMDDPVDLATRLHAEWTDEQGLRVVRGPQAAE